jgi:hypothetical protein
MIGGPMQATTFSQLSNAAAWRLLVEAARMAAEASGYELRRLPGRGLSNVWRIEKGGVARKAAIRTSRDRWIAFPPLSAGSKWKTLDDVDIVIFAAVDRPKDPGHIEVFVLAAAEVRRRFQSAYAMRRKAGLKIRDGFGMWIKLDRDNRQVPASAGSGLADTHEPLAVFRIEDLLAERQLEVAARPKAARRSEAVTGILEEARRRVADALGVRPETLKLDLKVEF